MKEAREGLAGCAEIKEMSLKENTCWYLDGITDTVIEPFDCLLPPFDEYLLGYQNRNLMLHPAHTKLLNRGGGMFKPAFLLGGRVAGIWRKIDWKEHLQVDIQLFTQITASEKDLLGFAVQRLGQFYCKMAVVRLSLP